MLQKLRGLLSAAITKITSIPPNRVVVALAVPIATASAWITGWVAENAPGLPALSPEFIGALMAGAAVSALGFLWSWLRQWQAQELGPPTAADAESLEGLIRKGLEHLPPDQAAEIMRLLQEGGQAVAPSPAFVVGHPLRPLPPIDERFEAALSSQHEDVVPEVEDPDPDDEESGSDPVPGTAPRDPE